MIDFGKKRKKSSDIILIPLIDVIFLLIIFFLMAGNFTKQDILPIELPNSKNEGRRDEPQSYIVLGNMGEILVGEKFITKNELKDVLKILFTEKKDQPLFIKADGRMRAKDLIEIMRVAEKAGGKNISIVTGQK